MKIVMAVVALLTVSLGCDTLSMGAPVGTEWTNVECQRLDGTWLLGDGRALEAHVQGPKKIVIGQMDWDDKSQQFIIRNYDLAVTHLDNIDLVFMKVSDVRSDLPDAKDGFFFAQILMKDDVMLVARPRTDFFLNAIQSKQIQGVIVEPKRLPIIKPSSDENLDRSNDPAEVPSPPPATINRTKHGALEITDNQFRQFLQTHGVKKCFDHEDLMVYRRSPKK